MKEACRKAYSVGHKRLLAAMYTCDVQASMEVLGKVYGVISKRDGKVIDEDMVEGADIFNIKGIGWDFFVQKRVLWRSFVFCLGGGCLKFYFFKRISRRKYKKEISDFCTES